MLFEIDFNKVLFISRKVRPTRASLLRLEILPKRLENLPKLETPLNLAPKITLPEIAKRTIQKSKSVSDFKNVTENNIDRGYESEPEMEENLNVPIITTDLASIKSIILGRVSGNPFQAVSFMPCKSWTYSCSKLFA